MYYIRGIRNSPIAWKYSSAENSRSLCPACAKRRKVLCGEGDAPESLEIVPAVGFKKPVNQVKVGMGHDVAPGSNELCTADERLASQRHLDFIQMLAPVQSPNDETLVMSVEFFKQCYRVAFQPPVHHLGGFDGQPCGVTRGDSCHQR